MQFSYNFGGCNFRIILEGAIFNIILEGAIFVYIILEDAIFSINLKLAIFVQSMFSVRKSIFVFCTHSVHAQVAHCFSGHKNLFVC